MMEESKKITNTKDESAYYILSRNTNIAHSTSRQMMTQWNTLWLTSCTPHTTKFDDNPAIFQNRTHFRRFRMFTNSEWPVPTVKCSSEHIIAVWHTTERYLSRIVQFLAHPAACLTRRQRASLDGLCRSM